MTTDTNKWLELSKLSAGDKVTLTNGQVAEFVRLKQKKFIGIMDGASYDIPVSMYASLKEKSDKDPNAYKQLKKGEPFYIDRQDGKAILFIFDSIKNGKIIGFNPISQGKSIIDPSLYSGKVSDIKI